MWSQFINLLVHAWNAMIRATGTTTLGFIVWTLAIAVAGWASTVVAKWFEIRREKTDSPFRKALLSSARSGAYMAGGIAVVVLITFTAFLVRTVYDLHQTLVEANRRLIVSNESLNAELELRKHSISTTDPVFPNTIYLLQAFSQYRHAVNGAPCTIKITAPPESSPVASMVAQFSNSVTGCTTFGPMPFNDPDVEKETISGMDPNLIVFHAARSDKAADVLFVSLGNLIQLKRSYQVSMAGIATPNPQNFIWLQFGDKTTWNSERR